MTSGDLPEFYPQYCFQLSPTIHRWCHLRAADIWALTTHAGFEGQNIYFHINHPIKWVRVAGVIVAVDEFAGVRVYTLDDGSGATIDCVALTRTRTTPATAPTTTTMTTTTTTTMMMMMNMATTEHQSPHVPNDLDVGHVVDVKGGLAMFRDRRQVAVEKAVVLPSTQHEVAFWARAADLRHSVLGRPWVLRRRDVRRCRREAEGALAKTGGGRRTGLEPGPSALRDEAASGRSRRTGLEPGAPAPSRDAGAAVQESQGAIPLRPNRRTGLEPGISAPARDGREERAPADAAGQGQRTITATRRRTGLEPGSPAPARDEAAAVQESHTGIPLRTRTRRTGLEPVTRRAPAREERASVGAVVQGQATAVKTARRTGLEPGSSAPVRDAGATVQERHIPMAARRRTGLEAGTPAPTPAWHEEAVVAESQEEYSRSSAATIRRTGLEPRTQTSRDEGAPRRKRITGLERRRANPC